MKLKVRAAFDRRAKLCKQTFILIPHSFLIRGIEFVEFLMNSLGWNCCWKLIIINPIWNLVQKASNLPYPKKYETLKNAP